MAMKPVFAVLRCTAALVLFGMANIALLGRDTAQAQGAGGACSATPCHLPNLFDLDLADLKSYHNQLLDDAANAAAKSVNNNNKDKDSSCYPDPVTLTVFTKPNSDPSFTPQIASLRMGALIKYFEGQGVSLNSIYPVSTPASASNGPGSDGTADVTFNDVDRDPPNLKTNSKPAKGTKVKTGDRIEVHATASERYADGHNSWPSGVKAIQLIANGILFKSEDYGMKPPPCVVRHFDPVYTVPSNPPPVVQLRVVAEDAAGHDTFEEADFPTTDIWEGTMRSVTNGTNPVGSCTGEIWAHDLRINVDSKGIVSGEATSHLVAPPKCSGPPSWVSSVLQHEAKTAAFVITGELHEWQFQLRFAETRIDGGTGGLLNYSLGMNAGPTLTIPLVDALTARGDIRTNVPVPNSNGSLATGLHHIELHLTTF